MAGSAGTTTSPTGRPESNPADPRTAHRPWTPSGVPISAGRARARGPAAFTLIELVLVMAMLLVVLAVAYPSLRNFFRGRNLDSEARRFLSLTRYAQSRAVGEGLPMVLWIEPSSGLYGLEAQTGYVDQDDKALEYQLDESLTVEVSRPPAILSATATGARPSRGAASASAAASRPSLRFTPDGFIPATSPERVVIRQGTEGAVGIVLSGNRLHYEIESEPGPMAAPAR